MLCFMKLRFLSYRLFLRDSEDDVPVTYLQKYGYRILFRNPTLVAENEGLSYSLRGDRIRPDDGR